MLYHLLVPLAKDHIVFNVFRYLTFRSFMALISALVISLVIGPWLIRRLRGSQHGGRRSARTRPSAIAAKKGTPTMGGVVILTALLGRRCCGRISPTATSGWRCWRPAASGSSGSGTTDQAPEAPRGSRRASSSCPGRWWRWPCCSSCSGSRRRLAAGAGHSVLQGLAREPRLALDSVRDRSSSSAPRTR